ncbi:MAG: hypothetical protein WBW81_08635, partial [Methylocella sp.]
GHTHFGGQRGARSAARPENMVQLNNEETPLERSKDAEKPADAEAGAALVRKFAIKLFDRDEGEAANWKLIAETLFKAAFDALDRSPDDASRVALLRRVHAGSYDPDGLILRKTKRKPRRAGMRPQRRICSRRGRGLPMRSGIQSERFSEAIATMLIITPGIELR